MEACIIRLNGYSINEKNRYGIFLRFFFFYQRQIVKPVNIIKIRWKWRRRWWWWLWLWRHWRSSRWWCFYLGHTSFHHWAVWFRWGRHRWNKAKQAIKGTGGSILRCSHHTYSGLIHGRMRKDNINAVLSYLWQKCILISFVRKARKALFWWNHMLPVLTLYPGW